MHYGDSHSGSVQVGAAVFNLGGTIWGDVTTNGANVIPSSNIHGIIDNNVPFTVPPCAMPTNLPAPSALLTTVAGIVNLRPLLAGTPAVPNFYQLSSLSGSLTTSPALVGLLALPVSTYVVIHVTNDMTAKIVVKPNVHAQIYFDGNMAVPAGDIVNESGIASDLQYYAISPSTPGTTQTISIASPGNFAAVIHAPNADVTLTGNPTVTGAIVCKNYNGNGNTSWHYDTALNVLGTPVDYCLISYVEDTR